MWETETEKTIKKLILDALVYCDKLNMQEYTGVQELYKELQDLIFMSAVSFETKLRLKDFYIEKYKFSKELEKLEDILNDLDFELSIVTKLDIVFPNKEVVLYATVGNFIKHYSEDIEIDDIIIYKSHVLAIKTTEYNREEYTGEKINVRKLEENE